MSNVAKLKKQAAELEQKKQFDKALAVYVKLLESFDEYANELDVGLFNRVGDLMLRQGNVADAVDYYEKAVDRYSDTGFFNNAIALCNKILRHSPGRASVYYKLGKISAQKGFKNDAKVNFLEYADRMKKSGKVDESFRALKEFADLCPDQDEIRLMLSDQLTKADRKDEAVEQLQILYARYQSEGRAAEADATAERIRGLDPSVEIKTDAMNQQKSSGSDLVFLDLDSPTPRNSVRIPFVVPPPESDPAPPTESAQPVASPTPADSLVVEAPVTRADIALHGTPASAMDSPLSGITRIGEDALGIEKTPTPTLLGLESTHLGDTPSGGAVAGGSLLDIEPTSLAMPEPVHRSSAPTHAPERETPIGGDLDFVMPTEPVASTPATPRTSSASVDIDLSDIGITTPLDSPVVSSHPTPAVDRAASVSPLEGLPLMDLDVPAAKAPAPRPPRTTASLHEIADSDDLGLLDEPAAAAAPELIDLNAESLTLDDVTPDGPGVMVERFSIEEEDQNADEETDEGDEPVSMPTPSVARKSTMVALQSVEILSAAVEGEPENWSLRRELAEAMLEAGDRAGGIRELESAMSGAERSNDLDLASSLADEVARLEPDSVKHNQKRVEYAYRTNDRPRLIEAYLALGDSLLKAEQNDKARTIFQRVIELAPDEMRAQTALDSIVVPEPPPPPTPAPRASGSTRRTVATPAIADTPPQAAAPTDFVNLGDWLRDDDEPKDTRMVVAEQEPTGDEDADFADMLRKFKQGVAENVDAEDYQSHYDLAIAFKEMGLLDEAIAEFQKALGGSSNRLPTFEALGQCFLEKGQPKLATSILSRALNERATEDQLVGVFYLLGRSAEEQGNPADALSYYQRVFVLDIQFRDIAERMSELERAAR